MPQPIFQVLSGAINGVNLVFYFSSAYTPGTVVIYRNSQLLLNGAGNPWMESNPSIGEVTLTMDALPIPGDTIAGFAMDASPVSAETVVTEISVTIQDALYGVSGRIETYSEFGGSISFLNVGGSISDVDLLSGNASDVDSISGVVE